ncbi:uncharacterized protein LOC143914772 [Arctopsyche grandis]|uniref:uncharacterized protein LOC143914772 n=1 Tax=Arctopsyche grandis TaxID=121162 RepID=UPI00406D9344
MHSVNAVGQATYNSRNQTGYEDALRLMRGEIDASRHLHERMRTVEERQRKRIEDMTSKLRDAIDQNAKLSEQLGEARAISTNIRESPVNDPRAMKRERELMQRVREERAGAETLREALEAAASAQTRLLSLRAAGVLVSQTLNDTSPTKPQ